MYARQYNVVVFMILLLSVLAVPAQAMLVAQTQQTWFVGGWRGTITQARFGTYDGVFSLQSASVGEVFGSSSYIELGCGGKLTLLRVSDTSLEFQEELTYGLSRCISGVKKMLTHVSDSSLGYATSPGQSGTATATLSQASNAALPAYLGNWRGRITQGASLGYTGVFSFTQGNVGDRFGTSRYIELGCGGVLTLLSVTATNMKFQEQITYGGGCITGVRKTITFVSPNILDYAISPNQRHVATVRLTAVSFVYLPIMRR